MASVIFVLEENCLSALYEIEIIIFKEHRVNIYVGNLPFSVTEEMLRQVFAQTGEVTVVKIITDAYSGRPKGFGFVEMPNQTEAQRAIKELNSHALDGRNIIVNEARPKTERPRRISRY